MAFIDKSKLIQDPVARAKAELLAQQDNAKDAFTKKTKIDTEAGKTKQRAYGFVEDNRLHKYASYNYVFTLSALSREELQFPHQILSNPPHDIIARTGGIGDSQNFGTAGTGNDSIYTNARSSGSQIFEIPQQKFNHTSQKAQFAKDILKKNRDIYFQKVEIDSFPWFNQERKLMNFTKIEMNLTEPTGITLWQKIRAAAANNGFDNHLSAPFLLTVEFKGYKTNGEQVTDASLSRRLPITLTVSNMQLNSGGATYNLTAVPWKDFAKNNAFLYTRGSGKISGSGNDLSSYLKGFADSLNKNMKQEVRDQVREYPDTYRITADKKIGGTANYDNTYESTGLESYDDTGSAKQNENRLTAAHYKSNQSIAKLLEDFVKQFDQYSKIDEIAKKYWADIKAVTAYDHAFDAMPSPMVPWFKIDSTVTVHPEFDTRLKSHKRTIHFHVKPYAIHIANFARAGLGGHVTWTEYVRKVYDYIYTGRNLDILDLSIDYNNSYALSTLVDNTETSIGKKLASTFYKIVKYFGPDRFPEPDLPVQEHPTTSRTEFDSVIKLPNQAQVQEFYDFLTTPKGDMVRIDMRIMGDPAFIGQDMFLPLPTPEASGFYDAGNEVGSINGFEWDSKIGAFNFDRAECFIRLNFVFPSDFDENKGLYTFTQGETPQFNGLYRVNGVRSVFDNGQFTQTLDMSRYMNQDNPNNVITVPPKNNSTLGGSEADNNTGAVNSGGDAA